MHVLLNTESPITGLDIFLWGVLPYLTAAVLIGGTVWRARYDQFGWTTRSSQLYESKLLKVASRCFTSRCSRCSWGTSSGCWCRRP